MTDGVAPTIKGAASHMSEILKKNKKSLRKEWTNPSEYVIIYV